MHISTELSSRSSSSFPSFIIVRICCEVGIKYIVKTNALQRCHHFALKLCSAFNSQFLASHAVSYCPVLPDYCDLLDPPVPRKPCMLIVSFPQCSGRTMGNTLSTQCTVGAIDGLIIRHIYCGTGSGVLYILHMHGLTYRRSVHSIHLIFFWNPGLRGKNDPRVSGNFLGKKALPNSQIVGNLL